MLPHGSGYPETGEQWVVVWWRSASNFLSLSAAIENLCSVRARWPAESNICERVNVNFADREMLPRVNGFDSSEALPQSVRKNALHRVHRRLSDVQRRLPQTEHLRQAVAVVGMFVSDEDAVEMLDGFFDGGEPGECFALAEPRVHEESGALRLE